jgi:cell division protein FtsZ
MTSTAQAPNAADLRPRLTVIGVGGAGCNAINNMIAAGLTGVNFVVANTDAQSLAASSAEFRIQLGSSLTEGLGAGSKPEIGQAAAEEAIAEIRETVAGSHMVFVAAGMGGGTGTGAAAVIARVARELGILTVGVVTKPFQFEGARRMRTAEDGIVRLRDNVDTLIVIPNQNLFRIANDKTTFAEAFILADQVLYSGVACIVDLIVKEGLINLDFADVRTVMSGMGTAMMGTGEASGPGRATVAAEEAISNPLLDDVTLKGAKGLLLSITGGKTLTLYEVDEAATRVRQEIDPEANVIVGATFDEDLDDRIRVSIVASGMSRLAADLRQHAGMMPPPLPQAPAFPQQAYAPAPVLDEMRDRLSHALSTVPAQVPDRAAQPPIMTPAQAAAPPPLPPQRGWTAPGGVRIEEPFDDGTSLPEWSQSAPSAHTGFAPAPAEPAFAPMPPAEFQRQRRMPEVQDFPIVGQRDYMSKKSGGWSNSPHTAPPEAAKDSAPPRKGWFSRFAGRNSAKSDSAASAAGSTQSGVNPADRASVRQRSAAPTPSDAYGSQSAKAQETPDLPVFFSGRRK